MSVTILRQRYSITEPLAKAGFGATYLAKDLDLPHTPLCVVKQLQPRSDNPSVQKIAKRLFAQEAEILYRLGAHDQIPRLLAYFQENQQFYLVQEFIEGHNLGEELHPGECWQESQVVTFLQDALQVLQFVHQSNIIHRDLKPSNIIRRVSDNQLVLIDFGAVKQIRNLVTNPQEKSKLTVAIGTPGYMPMEQQAGKPRLNSDIYALGMIAIYALTGIVPDQLPDDPATGEVIWRDHAQVSEGLAIIVEQMVRSQWRDRYQCVDQVLAELNNYQQPKVYTKLQTAFAAATSLQTPRRPKLASVLSGAAIVGIGITTAAIPNWLSFSPASLSNPTQASLSPPSNLNPHPIEPKEEAQHLFKRGAKLIELGLHQEALAAYRRAIKIDPQYAEAHREVCQILSSLGDHQSALAACDRALTINPNYAEALSSRCGVLVNLGRTKEAIADCEQACDLKPDSYIVWNDMGSAFEKMRRDRRALDAYAKALELKPDLYFAWNNRGNLLIRQRRYREALEAYNQAIKLQPELHYAWNGRAYALQGLRRYEESLSAYDQVIALKPDLQMAIEERKKVLHKLGR